MRSKWKLQRVPAFCLRKNFLNIFTPTISIDKQQSKKLRLIDGTIINVGSCKKFRIFRKLNGYVLEVYTGCNSNNIHVNEEMLSYYVGSFAFTKRFTGEIHKDQIQSRQKRAFNKSKKK